MSYHFLMTLLIVDCVISSSLNNYSIIIIPISRASRTIPLRPQTHRIDTERYYEPTEISDFDQCLKDYITHKNDFIRYLDGKKGMGRVAVENNNIYDEIDESGELNELDDNDESYNSDDRIVDGIEVDINFYPYHVAYGKTCGGAIIASKWVITAAHCGKKSFIRAGSRHINQGIKVNVKNNYIHPAFAANSKEHPFDYDFQVLELEKELRFGYNIQPIKVAHMEDMVIGKVVTVTGWGNLRENGQLSPVLMAVRLPIISKENCQHVPFPCFRGSLTPRMFCAGFAAGGKDACQGDSGGPATSGDRLVGVVSFGYGCATPGSYGVYSKVAKVRRWIEDITGLTLN